MPIEYVEGDLLAATDLDAIAQGCNVMGRMGSGIAKSIREKYGEAMFEQYATRCRTGHFIPGSIHFWAAEGMPHLYNLGTQDQPGPHAKLKWVFQSFEIMLGHASLETRGRARRVTRIGIPRIGAGIGGLVWENVEGVVGVLSEFFPTLTITVFTLPEVELRNSDAWSSITGIKVIDPDGWDRSNFEESWSEKISEEEFRRRVSRSTINQRWTTSRS